MMIAAYSIFSVTLIACALVLFRRNAHIFQLNSYKRKVQQTWLRDHIEALMLRSVWALALAPLVDTLGTLGLYLSSVILLAVLALNLPRAKEKKPFVFTGRMKRLLVTYLLLHVFPLLFVCFAPDRGAFGALLASLCIAAAPWLLLLADGINRPVEAGINRRYINEAKRILRESPNLTVIGVTGSYGKTSTKFFLEKLLSVKYNTLVTPENYNTTLGVVRTVRERLRATHDIFVCEMGARNVGDIKEICDLVHPKYGVITAVGEQHLESFGSIGNIVKTKFELADALPENGVLFANTDNDRIRNRCRNRSASVVRYGLNGGDYTAENIRVSPRGSSFTVRGVEFETKLLGAHNVQNLCGAIAVANTLGIPLEQLRLPVRQLAGVAHRLQLLGGGKRCIIDDAYNSNPAGALAALEQLASFDALRILVTPGMVELGADQERLNRTFGAQAASRCDYAVLVGQVNREAIRAGLLAEGFPAEKLYCVDTLSEAVARADALEAERNRVILLENDLPDNY